MHFFKNLQIFSFFRFKCQRNGIFFSVHRGMILGQDTDFFSKNKNISFWKKICMFLLVFFSVTWSKLIRNVRNGLLWTAKKLGNRSASRPD